MKKNKKSVIKKIKEDIFFILFIILYLFLRFGLLLFINLKKFLNIY